MGVTPDPVAVPIEAQRGDLIDGVAATVFPDPVVPAGHAIASVIEELRQDIHGHTGVGVSLGVGYLYWILSIPCSAGVLLSAECEARGANVLRLKFFDELLGCWVADRGRPVAEVTLKVEEHETLVRWSRRAKSSQALAQRCRIVLGCAEGKSNQQVATELGIGRRRWVNGGVDSRNAEWRGWWTSHVRAPRARSLTSGSKTWSWPL